MTKTFEELRAEINADPRRRARVDAYKQDIYTALSLAELRKRRAITQKQMAATLGLSQARISQIERGENLELATVSNYIAALGGHLRMSAAFPDAVIPLTEIDTYQHE
jgi:DNA-binding XRE family transcriptional regulator